jgi:hypothetical protein
LFRNRALRGVLFWRWDLNVYAGMPPADYGLLAGDTTFDIVRRNADQVKSLMVSMPPAPSCKLGCWVPAPEHISSKKTLNKCAPIPWKPSWGGCREKQVGEERKGRDTRLT